MSEQCGRAGAARMGGTCPARAATTGAVTALRLLILSHTLVRRLVSSMFGGGHAVRSLTRRRVTNVRIRHGTTDRTHCNQQDQNERQ